MDAFPRTFPRAIATAFVACVAAGAAALFVPSATLAANPDVETAAFWRFGTEETTRLEPLGAVHRDQPGPRPPAFPDMDAANTAVRLDGRGARFRMPDPGDDSPFDFTNGQSITLEAWVNLPEIASGENLYIVSKGRTHEAGFPKDNQNWALRVREAAGSVRVSFLFFSEPGEMPGDWHRWTSNEGFTAGSGWHHVAVTYTFGKPASIRGWLDGRPVAGTWDMGGATTRGPVVDNDAVWIGSSQGGSPSNSFRGLLDEIAIHRGVLADDVIRGRYRPTKDLVPQQDSLVPLAIVPGRVSVAFHEGLAAHDRWPADDAPLDPPVQTWQTDAFLFPRLPARYDDAGIRAAWKPTVLMRAGAEIQLPPGRHRVLIRSRGGARLWLDGRMVARTPFHLPNHDGHGEVSPDPPAPAPGARLVGYGDQEAIAEIETSGGSALFVFETLAGGKKFRAETGECCIAIQLAGEDQFRLVATGSGQPTWLTNSDIETARQAQERALAALDAQTRRAAAASQDEYWRMRHERARQWARSNPAPAVPRVAEGWPVHNDIDRFLAARMEEALAAGKPDAKTVEFHERVLPILRENCFRCHGDKERGGLRLNSLATALRGGDSGEPALVPGKPGDSELLRRVTAGEGERMPPQGAPLKAEDVAILTRWIEGGAAWPDAPIRPEEVTPAPLVGDAAFLRRVYLDTVGVPPTAAEARAFLADRSPGQRARLIDGLLADPRWADHWVGYWQDALAENPSLVKPTLNNSGPFRYFLHDALVDNVPMDRFVSELVAMRGSVEEGGSAGFALAADNDVPMAAKAHILAGAFLAVEMQCARCHDSPYHATTQKDLFSLAAMLERKPITLPATSAVPKAFFEKKGRESLIRASLKPGQKIEPVWPFADIAPSELPREMLADEQDPRLRLAAAITAPENSRFARVVVNRLWQRFLGAGMVEPVHDWEGRRPSHEALLDWLANELVANEYNLKHVARLILNSHAYQREAVGRNAAAEPRRRFFAAPDRRRLTAEQVVDSLYAAAGKPMRIGEITFDHDGRQTPDRFLNLGQPQRAWQFASLANERDRPSLSLPKAQPVIDALEAFGWQGSRQSPVHARPEDANVLQPGILANGTLSTWISRLSEDSELTAEAVSAGTPESLAETLYLRFLSRPPSDAERKQLAALLAPGFAARLTGQSPPPEAHLPAPRPRVSWTNHLNTVANRQMLEYTLAAQAGEPPTARLRPEWRERAEDAVWSVFNLPEFVWMP
jgi:hypothetical protein